jgi:hypothetical protein
VPGEVINAQCEHWIKSIKSPADRNLDIEHVFDTPEGHNVNAHAQISASDVADKVEPGVIVAVWYSPDGGYLPL